MQLGGVDMEGAIDKTLTWIPLLKTEDFKVKTYGLKVNNHFIAGSESTSVAFIDSGTTFSYFP
jgi:hypothetical protein